MGGGGVVLYLQTHLVSKCVASSSQTLKAIVTQETLDAIGAATVRGLFTGQSSMAFYGQLTEGEFLFSSSSKQKFIFPTKKKCQSPLPTRTSAIK